MAAISLLLLLFSLLTLHHPFSLALPRKARSALGADVSHLLTVVDSSQKNLGMGLESRDTGVGYLHYMATANKKGAHLMQAVASIREINVTAAAAIQAAAALPASQGLKADSSSLAFASQIFTSNMGGLLAYQGGQMMISPSVLNVYIVWYGTWTNKQKNIIRTFLQSLDRRTNDFQNYATVVGWWSINVRYYRNGQKKSATPYVTVKGEVNDNYSMKPLGTASKPMSHDQVRQLLGKHVPPGGASFPSDPSGAYLLLTAPDVFVADFCNGLCAYHTSAQYGANKLAYAFVGNPSSQCPQYCTYQYFDPAFSGINGDLGADAVLDKIGHELSELVTNPLHGPNDKPGWVVAQSQIENADLCEWMYGPVNYEGAGGVWNVRGKNNSRYLLQLNFNVRARACALQGNDSVVAGPSPMGGGS